MENLQKAILDAVDTLLNKKIKNLGLNYYVDGIIKSKNTDGTYNVTISGETYSNIPSKSAYEYALGDTVQILIKNGNWNKKFIDDKITHNKTPMNLLGIGKRTRINKNDDLNNYLTCGSYSIVSDAVAETIVNLPYPNAGILNIYSSNGNDLTTSSYKYLIQEYISLTGNIKYYRHIRKSGSNAEWEYRDWIREISEYQVKDYIVEQGTSGIWTYRKWNSGLAECWGRTNMVVTFTTAWGGLYTCGATNRINYPFTFIETPIETTRIYTKTYACWGYSESTGRAINTTTQTGIYNAIRATQVTTETTLYIDYSIQGRWK